ncbi:DMT family transporter [Allohahella marinimesophila]|uniref:DMT family transporter n=1 Tax=Allohahella marinimesophila TaxID=1054972 RepID=A0ABP7PGL2_9GAMM
MKAEVATAHALVLLATLLVAGSFIASARLASVLNPYSLTLLRFVCSVIILAPVVLMQPSLRARILPAMPRALIISFFFSAFFVCMFEALKTTTALNTAAIYTLVPLMTAIISRLVLGEKLAQSRVWIYLLGAAGACWVIFTGRQADVLSLSLNTGDLIFFGGAVLMACYAVSMKRLYRNDPMIVLVLGILLGGCFWMTIALLATGNTPDWQLLDRQAAWQMAYLVVGATIGTVYLFQRTIVVLGPSRVNAYIYLNPASVALLSIVVGDGPIPLMTLPGIAIAMLATILLQKRAQSAVPVSTPSRYTD